MSDYIAMHKLTKDYGHEKGIFDVSLSIDKGEVFGLVGVNGSGKTTTIRHLMGFLKPDKGKAFIDGKSCWKDSSKLKQKIGYIPGEIAFPNVATGMDFLKLQGKYLDLHDLSYAEKLIERFQLDPHANLKRMSKGMKQKTAIVSAFMNDPEILLLDEATTGLDPLMQDRFIELICEEKRRGKTIFMSSHMFDELEETCDRVAFLKDGWIIDVVNMKEIKGNETNKKYKIEFLNRQDYDCFLQMQFETVRVQPEYNQVTVLVSDQNVTQLLQVLAKSHVKFIRQIPFTLENYFKDKYRNMEVA